jgi:hypothetical protein
LHTCRRHSVCFEHVQNIHYPFSAAQAKFAHFGKVDAAKYNELWHMQQNEACDLVQQLLAADRVIHEQQLGWQWQPPEEALFVSPHDVVQANPGAASAASTGAAPTGSECGTRTCSSMSGRGALSAAGGSRQVSSGGGISSFGGAASPKASLSGSMQKAGSSRAGSSSRASGGGSVWGASSNGGASVQLRSAPEVGRMCAVLCCAVLCAQARVCQWVPAT